MFAIILVSLRCTVGTQYLLKWVGRWKKWDKNKNMINCCCRYQSVAFFRAPPFSVCQHEWFSLHPSYGCLTFPSLPFPPIDSLLLPSPKLPSSQHPLGHPYLDLSSSFSIDLLVLRSECARVPPPPPYKVFISFSTKTLPHYRCFQGKA